MGFTWVHLGSTSVSLQCDLHSTLTSSRPRFDFMSMWLQRHFKQLDFNFCLSSISLQLQSEFESVPIRFRCHFDATSSPHRVQLMFTSRSFQCKFHGSSVSCLFHKKFSFTAHVFVLCSARVTFISHRVQIEMAFTPLPATRRKRGMRVLFRGCLWALRGSALAFWVGASYWTIPENLASNITMFGQTISEIITQRKWSTFGKCSRWPDLLLQKDRWIATPLVGKSTGITSRVVEAHRGCVVNVDMFKMWKHFLTWFGGIEFEWGNKKYDNHGLRESGQW